jgi:hypothetical protein
MSASVTKKHLGRRVVLRHKRDPAFVVAGIVAQLGVLGDTPPGEAALNMNTDTGEVFLWRRYWFVEEALPEPEPSEVLPS